MQQHWFRDSTEVDFHIEHTPHNPLWQYTLWLDHESKGRKFSTLQDCMAAINHHVSEKVQKAIEERRESKRGSTERAQG